MDEPYGKRHRAPAPDLTAFLENVGQRLTVEVHGYLIGGCAMSLRGLKDATKDCDVIVETRAERDALRRVMRALEYSTSGTDPFTTIIPKEYEGFRGDLHRKKGHVGLDVFERVVMDKFELTESMKARAETPRRYGSLVLHCCSNEDICLFKLITHRPDDEDDVLTLIASGLDVAGMRHEAHAQPRRLGRPPWPDLIVERLASIEERRGIEIPWKHEIA